MTDKFCPNGHLKDYIDKTGKPHCRICSNEAMRRLRSRISAKRIEERNISRSKRVSPCRDDCIWAAGHFEGEGTVTMGGAANKGRTRVIVTLTSTDADVIDFFQIRWPGIYQRYMPQSRTGNAREAIKWTLNSFESVRAFLLDIKSHVRTQRVSKKIDVVLEDIEDRSPYSRNPNARERSLTRKSEIMRLNHRGARPFSLLPDGQTVADHVKPKIKMAYETGNMLPLLPGPQDKR